MHRTPRMLIVEDDDALLSLISAVLPSDAYVVLERDGIAGVGAFRQALNSGAPFEIVCLDLLMPGMDGGRALRAMRRLEAEHGCAPSARSRIIMMSTEAERTTVQRAVAAGADDYLVKPFTPDDLLHRLRLDPELRSA